tara:strand:+ start:1223 stop:1435 length:213 start_codon:yes stop_codon:yes gene_type:complete
MMEGNYESDFQGDLPYVALELDILDVHGIYKAVCFHLEKWPGGDPYEQERLQHLKDFLYRIILEYKYQID